MKVMPFGKYKGVAMNELPAQYVDWLLDQDWVTTPLRSALARRHTSAAKDAKKYRARADFMEARTHRDDVRLMSDRPLFVVSKEWMSEHSTVPGVVAWPDSQLRILGHSNHKLYPGWINDCVGMLLTVEEKEAFEALARKRAGVAVAKAFLSALDDDDAVAEVANRLGVH